MREGGSQHCAAMNRQLVSVLTRRGFSSSDTPFRREEVRYEFRRRRSERAEVVAVLFNRKREALFSVQLYIEPPQGAPAFSRCGRNALRGRLECRQDLVGPLVWSLSAPLRRFSTASEGIA